MRDYRFGNFLRGMRERRGLSQYQLGMLVGVSDKAVSKWENGLSKPKSGLLYPISEVLGIRVDELLACRCDPADTSGRKGESAMKNILWKKASDALYAKYGACPPPGILNRYFSEYAEFRDSDAIVFYDFLGRLAAAAKQKNEAVRLRGTTGSSFVAYLLGATDLNPLEAHDYCPRCKTVRFAENAPCGWDLPEWMCSCGGIFTRDGLNLPFEVLRRSGDFRSEVFSVSHGFYRETLDFMKAYFADSKIISLSRENAGAEVFVIVPEEVSGYADGQTLPFEEYNLKLRSYPRLMITRDSSQDALRMLGERTGYPYDRVDFTEEKILHTLASGDTAGIPEFDFRFIRSMLAKEQPQSCHELLQICGLAHGIGTWDNNAEALLNDGLPLAETIAYQEDVFRYVQSRMNARDRSHTGLAYRIMENARRGIYARDGLPEEDRRILRSVGADAWFADCIAKTKYLFPKAHGAEFVRFAMIFTWYKVHFPKEFAELCKNRRE